MTIFTLRENTPIAHEFCHFVMQQISFLSPEDALPTAKVHRFTTSLQLLHQQIPVGVFDIDVISVLLSAEGYGVLCPYNFLELMQHRLSGTPFVIDFQKRIACIV